MSRQRIACKDVCRGGTSGDSTTIQEAVFCNFDLTYFTCCLHPPPNIPCDGGGSLEALVQSLPFPCILIRYTLVILTLDTTDGLHKHGGQRSIIAVLSSHFIYLTCCISQQFCYNPCTVSTVPMPVSHFDPRKLR